MLSKTRQLFRRAASSDVTRTTAVNYLTIVVMAGGSILVARALGAEGRGEFAAIMAWFSVALALGELGQSGAVTYWVARANERAPGLVAAGRVITFSANLVVGTIAVLLSHWLASGDSTLTFAYLIVFAGCFANGIWGPLVYAAQAVSLPAWNLIRLSQPVVYAVAIVILFAIEELDIVSLATVLTLSVVSQFVVAAVMARRLRLSRGRVSRRDSGNLLRYGAAYAGSQVPLTLAAQYDKVVLSRTVSDSDLGQYAVAGTVAGLSGPLSTAISSVIFPRMSVAGIDPAERNRAEVRVILLTGLSTGAVLVGLVVAAAPLVPLVFGAEFAPAVSAVWWLAPAMLFRAISQVIAVFIRSRARPGTVTWARLAGLTAGALTIVPFIHGAGIFGAALSLIALETVTLIASGTMLWILRRTQTLHVAE